MSNTLNVTSKRLFCVFLWIRLDRNLRISVKTSVKTLDKKVKTTTSLLVKYQKYYNNNYKIKMIIAKIFCQRYYRFNNIKTVFMILK